MSGLEDFLRRAKETGADKAAHWEVSLNDGSYERGRILGVLPDALLLEQTVKRNSANTRHDAVRVIEDRIETLIPFASIKLVRAALVSEADQRASSMPSC